MKPIIGISCSLGAKREAWIGKPNLTYDYVKREYHRRIEEHGGIPVLLPIVSEAETIREIVAHLSGLLLTGGEDMDPIHYGEDNRYPQSKIHPERDRFELGLLARAEERRMPVFGICRGIQVMNVFYGGTLHQDVSLRPGTGIHHSDKADVYFPHAIKINSDSRLFRLAGKPVLEVNSRHHQALNRLASGFAATAIAEDGIIEAIERMDASGYRMGVQWHPELMPESACTAALFKDFISHAAQKPE